MFEYTVPAAMAKQRGPYLRQATRSVGHSRRPNFILAWRLYRKMTQEALSELTGISVPHISLLESAKAGYSEDSLNKLAEALHTEPGHLLSRAPPNEAGERLTAQWEKLSQTDKDLALRLIGQIGKP